uniref:Mediator of RNA polymerase II transcription subunit 13 n=1 Tax=Timema monikensis TaxID=170555 RepID=A0A7R9E166_9NEOP|nr:unnamed protein product [Timema monikensis]
MDNVLRRTSVASDVVAQCLLQTDLCGIRWRKLVWGECGFSPEPMDDPVLSSFSRCLAVDILCVWRRVAAAQPPGSGGGGGLFDSFGLPPAASSQPAAQQHPPLSLHAAKELWIFWYGEEPDLSGLVAPELISSGKCFFLHALWRARTETFHTLHCFKKNCSTVEPP